MPSKNSNNFTAIIGHGVFYEFVIPEIPEEMLQPNLQSAWEHEYAKKNNSWYA